MQTADFGEMIRDKVKQKGFSTCNFSLSNGRKLCVVKQESGGRHSIAIDVPGTLEWLVVADFLSPEAAALFIETLRAI